MSDIPEWLYEYLILLDKVTLVEVLLNSVDNMQMYNGRSHTFCIVTSIVGATAVENDDGTYTYTLPGIDQVTD